MQGLLLPTASQLEKQNFQGCKVGRAWNFSETALSLVSHSCCYKFYVHPVYFIEPLRGKDWIVLETVQGTYRQFQFYSSSSCDICRISLVFLFWVEKDAHNADSQNLKNSKQSSAKINNIYGVYLFSIQSKNSFIESPGKNVPLTTYIIHFIDCKNDDDKIVSFQSLSADTWVSLRKKQLPRGHPGPYTFSAKPGQLEAPSPLLAFLH